MSAARSSMVTFLKPWAMKWRRALERMRRATGSGESVGEMGIEGRLILLENLIGILSFHKPKFANRDSGGKFRNPEAGAPHGGARMKVSVATAAGRAPLLQRRSLNTCFQANGKLMLGGWAFPARRGDSENLSQIIPEQRKFGLETSGGDVLIRANQVPSKLR